MHYQSETIATVLNRLNINYFLPAIQREYVWGPGQIIQLFDSLMRNYPIGSFLFWELHEENRYRWDVYKFIQSYKQDETHNEPARTDGVQQLTLILDGQQRLTSLFIGLKGTYTIKKKYLRWDNPDAWVKQSLYLDLLKDPKVSEDDSEEGLRFDFRFMEKASAPDGKSYWFKVGHILDCDSKDKFFELRDQEEEKLPGATTKHQIKVFQQNLDQLYHAIWKDDLIAYYTEQDQNYDRVLTIFVRANQGGTKLSKSDLLLSMVTAKWDAVNARDEIYEFVDRLNNDLTHKNNFDKDFIMKTCLVLSDLPVQYKVENFSNQNLMLIYSKWKRIKTAIERTVNLINSFGIDRDTLTSANALIPVIYYLYQHPDITLPGSTPFEVSNATRIQHWLLMALLNNAFSGQSDTALTYARRVVAEHIQEHGFPDEAMNAELRRSGRKAAIDDDTVDTILSFTYGKPLTFLALSLLYDDNRWGNINYHQDHIFPQALFTAKRMNSISMSAERQRRFLDLVNRVGNLELLLPIENLEKSSQEFEQWVATRDSSFSERHLIPNEENLLAFDTFEEFVAAREELIRHRLKTTFALPITQSSASSIPVPPTIPGNRQGFIHQLLYQLVDERPELERDICDGEVVRFGVTDWDVPVLKAGTRWPKSGRILLFTLVNRKQTLRLELGLGWSPEGTDSRERLFRMALSHEPPFKPAHYQELPLQWIYLYHKTFLTPQIYDGLSEDGIVEEIRKQWIDFVEHDLPKLDTVLKAQQWIWQPVSIHNDVSSTPENLPEMREDLRRVSQEEMHRRFDELQAIHDKTETYETIAQKWTDRKGEAITIGQVREYYRLVQPRFERGDDLHELAKVHGWSDIIWRL